MTMFCTIACLLRDLRFDTLSTRAVNDPLNPLIVDRNVHRLNQLPQVLQYNSQDGTRKFQSVSQTVEDHQVYLQV